LIVFTFAKEGVRMARLLLTDDEWDAIEDLFPEPKSTGRPPVDRRKVVDGIFWILRTGSPWRDLPEEFGAWKTAWRLFDEWNASGLWDAILKRLRASFIEVGEISGQLWCVDGTVVRAARCASGGGKKATRKSRLIMR
jgi:transposase